MGHQVVNKAPPLQFDHIVSRPSLVQVLTTMKGGSAPGLDGIMPEMFKNIIEEVVDVILPLVIKAQFSYDSPFLWRGAAIHTLRRRGLRISL